MKIKVMIHGLAATMALALVASFWLATLISEVFLDAAAVLWVKQTIVHYGLALMVATMAVTAMSGLALTRQRAPTVASAKRKRMPWLAMNGLLCLLPAAIFLYFKAAAGEFDGWFIGVQILELGMGLGQMVLLGRNHIAGVRLLRRRLGRGHPA